MTPTPIPNPRPLSFETAKLLANRLARIDGAPAYVVVVDGHPHLRLNSPTHGGARYIRLGKCNVIEASEAAPPPTLTREKRSEKEVMPASNKA